jgi:hypothetical protein
MIDRVIRIIFGIVLFYLFAVKMVDAPWSYLIALIGLILLVTGVVGACLLYSMLARICWARELKNKAKNRAIRENVPKRSATGRPVLVNGFRTRKAETPSLDTKMTHIHLYSPSFCRRISTLLKQSYHRSLSSLNILL